MKQIRKPINEAEEALGELEKMSIPKEPAIQLPTTQSILEDDFYVFTRDQIRQTTSQNYRHFLRVADYADLDYADLDNASELRIAKRLLRIDRRVRDVAARNNVAITGDDNKYLVNINQADARKIVGGLGGKLLTVGLMYRLFIPYIKELAQQNNQEAQATLKEMTNIKAEWLEDIILDGKRVRIGIAVRNILLPRNSGRFDRVDINEFGYPTSVKDQGEFYYWHVDENERAAIRGGSSVLVLNLDGAPAVADAFLGVRVAKIFI